MVSGMGEKLSSESSITVEYSSRASDLTHSASTPPNRLNFVSRSAYELIYQIHALRESLYIYNKAETRRRERCELTLTLLDSSLPFASLDQSSLRSSSSILRLHLPWEILLGVCQQSEEDTLRNLCLVSFGMLQLAGPWLYRDVEIRTLERLYSFFIPPSLIASSSRLRPSLGLPRLRNLHLDFEPQSKDHVRSIFPSSTWDLPHRRLVESPPTSLRFLSITLSLPDPAESLIKTHLLPFLHPHLEIWIRPFPSHSQLFSPQRVTFEYSTRIKEDDTIHVERVVQVPLGVASGIIAMVYRKLRSSKERDTSSKVVTRLDLRQIIVDASWKQAVLPKVEFASNTLLNNEELWIGIPNLEVQILVGSVEVGKVVNKLVERLESEERRSRCRVVLGEF
ncbi:hypothetical protein BDY24DRAFT_80966 [Mrakia frigida]|uniref:uncharacterized protein n=1 Tax=Mrakia frigida TaxID=29902 RepID=UPI003FCBFB5F